jgi:quinol monooxygenase YgiN
MSYLRLVRFRFSEGWRSHAQAMADDLVPAIKEQPGCLSAVFFSDDEGSSGLAVLWDSQAHADAAAAVIRPRLEQHLQGNVTAPPEAGLFPVLAS